MHLSLLFMEGIMGDVVIIVLDPSRAFLPLGLSRNNDDDKCIHVLK